MKGEWETSGAYCEEHETIARESNLRDSVGSQAHGDEGEDKLEYRQDDVASGIVGHVLPTGLADGGRHSYC